MEKYLRTLKKFALFKIGPPIIKIKVSASSADFDMSQASVCLIHPPNRAVVPTSISRWLWSSIEHPQAESKLVLAFSLPFPFTPPSTPRSSLLVNVNPHPQQPQKHPPQPNLTPLNPFFLQFTLTSDKKTHLSHLLSHFLSTHPHRITKKHTQKHV